MKLIEKKCPNCGASLEFKENEKSCTCEYCNSSYEIEKEEKDTKDLSEQYKLKKLSTVQKAAFAYIFGSYIMIGIVSFIVIAAITVAMIVGVSKTNSLITDASTISDSSYDKFDTQATFKIEWAKGDTSHHSFHDDEIIREKTYVAYKKKSNYKELDPPLRERACIAGLLGILSEYRKKKHPKLDKDFPMDFAKFCYLCSIQGTGAFFKISE